jgi:hypothetical protein
MCISSAGAFRTPPALLSSCLAKDDPQPRQGCLAYAFGMDPSSPDSSCRYDCRLCLAQVWIVASTSSIDSSAIVASGLPS